MKVVDQNNSEHYRWGGHCDGWHLLKSDGLSVIEELVPPGHGEVRHFHRVSQQFFYVLSGAIVLELDGAHYDVQAGSGMHVPANMPHQLMNRSDGDARFLVISQPKSHADKHMTNN